MALSKQKTNRLASTPDIEKLLADSYIQLLKWARVLTRGDEIKAQDLVQELCLYFTLTKPNLSEVANMDGYLYTCLRHLYLSSLARASREAVRFVSVAECDTIDFALDRSQGGDPLQRQNDLRRICNYAVWRKESSKSASYFILHFFHGYGRQEVADLARLPISAIYNKLKTARTEAREHLEEEGKLRILKRHGPSTKPLSWSLISSVELFRELRQDILQARNSVCLDEQELLALYRSELPSPISCSLIAHIVSCERCLKIIDQHFRRPTLIDREPVDGTASDRDPRASGVDAALSYSSVSREVRKRWGKIQEYRPRSLSLAINGKIIASYDVEAEHSKLSARIDHLESAEFVEVFSEQDVRLALISIGEVPPVGPETTVQHVELSDSRWLELSLTFDGLGLNGQIAYYDPALAVAAAKQDEEALAEVNMAPFKPLPLFPRWSWFKVRSFSQIVRVMTPTSAMAWSVLMVFLLGAGGFLFHRRATAPIDAKAVLSRSLSVEAAGLKDETEHQVIQLEETSANGIVLRQGSIDVWKDGNGKRWIRRLFDDQHRLIAAQWKNEAGREKSFRGKTSEDASESLLFFDFWDRDISVRSFVRLGGESVEAKTSQGGYELVTVGPLEGHPQLLSTSLSLDNRLHPIRQTIRGRVGGAIHELQFVQESYERRSSSALSDNFFDFEDEKSYPPADSDSHVSNQSSSTAAGTDLQLAELEVSVLYDLSKTAADTGNPIEIVRTDSGRIRISGMIASDLRLRKIRSELAALKDSKLLELKLVSPNVRFYGAKSNPNVGGTTVVDVSLKNPVAAVLLRKFYQKSGMAGERLEDAVSQFSSDALKHGQLALQHAYALQRLGNILSAEEFESIGRSSQEKWSLMVLKHSAALNSELNSLDKELVQLTQSNGLVSTPNLNLARIADPTQFGHSAEDLLQRTQELNRCLGSLFAVHSESGPQQNGDLLLRSCRLAIPLHESTEILRFANELHGTEITTLRK